MEVKKSKEANLEDKIVVFRSVGLVMVSAIVLMAFTRTTADIAEKVAENQEVDRQQDDALYDLIVDQPEPEQEETVAPPPPAPEDVTIELDDAEIEKIKFNDDPIVILPTDPGEGPDKIQEEEIIDFFDTEPVFPGGAAAMNAFITSKVVYPELSREMDEQGTVYVQFVVNTNGSIQDCVILKGVSGLLDAEAIRVVRLMPPWSPGEQAGKKVRVRYVIPINFRIE